VTYGLARKVILANNMAMLADKMFAASELSVVGAWLGAIAYTLQIYFDFSGYSDMAIGLGRMFGFHFNENFRNIVSNSINHKFNILSDSLASR
jgi:D-alanyl-lipoteichoic acid acyltransferase DltB (MBOAT superfamily)